MKKIYIITLILSFITPGVNAQWLWDINKLEEIKNNKHTFTYSTAYRFLLEQADAELLKKSYTVTDKKIVPSGIDKHDYVSINRYWWLNEKEKADSFYICYDNKKDSDKDKFDRFRLKKMCDAVTILSLAYYYTNEDRYAKKAVEILRAWFLNEETKMNPNLEYSGYTPVRYQSKGSAGSLLDSYPFIEMLNSIQLLKQSQAYTDNDDTKLKAWFVTFADWMQANERIKDDKTIKEEYAITYDLQLIAYLLFTGKEKEIKKYIEDFSKKYHLTWTEYIAKNTNSVNDCNEQKLSDRSRLLYGADDPIKEMFGFAAQQFDYAFTCVDSFAKKSTNTKQVTPRTIDENGNLHMVSPRDWCSGFFPGSLWFMYQYSKDKKWLEQADKFSMLIEDEQFDTTSHDVGFKMYNSFGNGYKLTDSEDYKKVIIQSAKTVSRRFNSKIGSIRSWDWNRKVWQYPVIIDNLMNLELLFEASKLTNNNEYYNIAVAHANTTLKNHFREDYSSFHVVDYDTISGNPRLKQTFQGYSDPSAWARGQAWALYGYTMSYRYTKNTGFLSHAEGIANFIFTHPNLPDDFIPYWDFNDPDIPNAPRDASAACITASVLYELAGYSPSNKEKYILWADKILESLIDKYRVKPRTAQGFLLLHSTGHLPGNSEIDVPINYADYYFLEALLRKQAIN